LAEDYKGKVTFVGVSNHDTIPDGRAYAEQFEVPYALGRAPDVWEQFDVPYQPVTIVLDEDGAVATRIDGAIDPAALAKEIESLL